ncbi:MAG: DUF1588 domain-containing protein [Kofleriaceae bacterium]
MRRSRRPAGAGPRLAPLILTLALGAGACSDDGKTTPLTGDAACDTLAILEARCVGCHSNPPVLGVPMALTSLRHLRSSSAAFPGATVADRSVARMAATTLPMPPRGPQVPAAELEVFHTWIELGMPACATDPEPAPMEEDPNQIPQDELFTCDGAPGASPGRLRRLGQDEWRMTVPSRDQLGKAWAGYNPMLANASDRYSTYTSDETVDDAVIDLLLDPGLLGGRVGDEVVVHLRAMRSIEPRLACAFTEFPVTPGCVTTAMTAVLERAVLFRPATADEVGRLAAFATQVFAGETAVAQRDASLARIVNTAALSTGALFRTELGDGTAGRARLTDAELAQALARVLGSYGVGTPRQAWKDVVANRIAYTAGLEGYYPDLAAAAADGSIQDPATLDALLRAHLGGDDPDRADLLPDLFSVYSRQSHGERWLAGGVRGFFREWLGYEGFPAVFKEQPGLTSQFQPSGSTSIYGAMNTSYRQLQTGYYSSYGPAGAFKESLLVDQLDDMIAAVVTDDHDVLRQLLTTRRFHVPAQSPNFNATQATQLVYNLADPIANDDPANRWVTLPASERAGVLTHPAWLATHGGNFEDDPSIVRRGKWVRENLLCQYVPPLASVMVPAMVGPSAPDLTARDRLDAATASDECQRCHQLMNPLGYPFEIYNHAGFLRSVDHDGGAPDGSSLLVDMPDPALDGPVTSAIDLMDKLAASGRVKRCFIRQSFRYFMGRPETRADACALAQMEQAYDVQGSFITMLSALVTSDAFRYRTTGGN